ncbi:hypothetical protein EDB81DRAFT_764939 [Dactylonectria macrodidyma]|uniref:Rhodopsin domain-containing protein n=1 Tax=Dactylonectria macrodidyma TaxID=307937 RepID=A0A9P9DV58_9HYPO|nr:hypothetical protein EDB81DRAFT_764939 [Dactylonectria macrodidyma]
MGDSRGPQVRAVAITFLVISTIATILRVYCRGRIIKAFAADDWLAVAAQILFIVFCAYEITGVHYGTGQHLTNLSSEQIPKAMQMWWTCEPLYVLANMAIKASIAIFLLRICVHKSHKITIYIVTAVTEIYSLFFFLLFVVQCRPTALFWLRYTANPPSGSCMDAIVVSNAFYGYSAISCWSDWTFSILPMFLVWKLQMNTRVKISVVLILAAGAMYDMTLEPPFPLSSLSWAATSPVRPPSGSRLTLVYSASSATIVRFPYIHSLTDIDDFLYSTSDVAIWSTVETGLGITASGFATLRPLLRTFFGGSSADGGGTSGRMWQRTDSNHPKGGYIRSRGRPVDGQAFELHDKPAKHIGVTTVINHDSESDLEGQKYKGDTRSEGSDSMRGVDDWNSSQSNLAERSEEARTGQGAWNITVKKSIVQTRGEQ